MDSTTETFAGSGSQHHRLDIITPVMIPQKPTEHPDRQPDMPPPANTERYKNHRFPGEIISHGVWLYYRFPLSYRDVQEILFERGIGVTYEAIRQWCLKFGRDYANRSGADGLGSATRGIWMRCFRPSTASVMTCGGR
jgi:hypothetical protein